MNGGLTGFKSCSLDGTTFVIVTNSNYNMDPISIDIENIFNPSVLKTDEFIITTIYDSQVINLTDQSTSTNRVL